MPVCQNCNEKWTWKQTVKKSFVLDTAMTCPYCDEKQYVTSQTRTISAILTFGAVTSIFLFSFLFNLKVAFVVAIMMFPLYTAIYPFTITLSNKETPIGRQK